MSNGKIRDLYMVNSEDTVVTVPASDIYRYLITPDSAFAAITSADAQAVENQRRGFRKRLAIPFIGLVLLLVFVVGFRDLTNPFFWVLMGIFAAASGFYALVWTDAAMVTYLPGAIRMSTATEDASELFAELTKKDRDTLFRAVEESGYDDDFLFQDLIHHYRRKHAKRTDRDWRMPRWGESRWG